MNLCFHFLPFMNVEHTSTDSIIHVDARVVLSPFHFVCVFTKTHPVISPLCKTIAWIKYGNWRNSMNKLKCTFFHVKHLVADVQQTLDTGPRSGRMLECELVFLLRKSRERVKFNRIFLLFYMITSALNAKWNRKYFVDHQLNTLPVSSRTENKMKCK